METTRQDTETIRGSDSGKGWRDEKSIFVTLVYRFDDETKARQFVASGCPIDGFLHAKSGDMIKEVAEIKDGLWDLVYSGIPGYEKRPR